ncbi:hypothetical protein ACWC5I_38305, partial [Kitasatospora sp. NPDC001574]
VAAVADAVVGSTDPTQGTVAAIAVITWGMVVGHLVRLQADAGGDGLLGRQLHPLLTGAGFRDVTVAPRTVYADGGRPELMEGFTRRTFVAMVESVRDEAVAAGLTTGEAFDRGAADLRRTAEPGGTFHYTFFKAVAVNP